MEQECSQPLGSTLASSSTGEVDGEFARVERLLQQQVKQCEALLRKKSQDEMLLKAVGGAKSALTKLKYVSSSHKGDDDDGSEDRLKAALQEYTQSVLDATYYDECQLVEQEFPLSTTQETIVRVVTTLAQPAISCHTPERAMERLGTDLLECIYWRVGSLMYMYCHTLMENNEQRRKEVDEMLIQQYCSVGVAHLELMLSARSPLSRDEDVICNDDGVKELLQQGVFSDIHMLAVMYAGELCYWSWSLGSSSKKQSSDTLQSPAGSKATARTEPSVGSSNVAQVPKRHEESKTLNIGNIETTSPSAHVAAQPLASSSSFDSVTAVTANTKVSDEADNVKSDTLSPSANTVSVKTLVVDSSNCPSSSGHDTGLEQTVQNFSLKDATTTTGCSVCCHGDSRSLLSQLFYVMEHCQGKQAVKNWQSKFDPLKRGQELLSKFVEVARGPLKAQGWKYGRAVQLLVTMKKAAHAQ